MYAPNALFEFTSLLTAGPDTLVAPRRTSRMVLQELDQRPTKLGRTSASRKGQVAVCRFYLPRLLWENAGGAPECRGTAIALLVEQNHLPPRGEGYPW